MVGNVFHLVETHGIPLEIILQKFEEHKLIIDWIDFYESSQKCGWLIKTVLNKIEVALVDFKGREYADAVMLRLKQHIINIGERDNV